MLLTLTSVRVDQVYEAGDLLDDADLSNASEAVGNPGWQADQVVFAHWYNLDAECILKRSRQTKY